MLFHLDDMTIERLENVSSLDVLKSVTGEDGSGVSKYRNLFTNATSRKERKEGLCPDL